MRVRPRVPRARHGSPAQSLLLVILAAALAAACGDDGATGPADSLVVSGDSVLVVGEPASFQAVLSGGDAGGVTWAVVHPSVAAVSENGEVTGHRPGHTGVVATAGALSDTAWVRVRWGELESGGSRGFVVAGTDTAWLQVGAYFRVSDVMDTETGDETLFLAENDKPARDTSVILVLPSAVAAGETAIQPYPLGAGELTAPAALLSTGTEGVDLRVYYGLGGTLDLPDVVYPERAGLTQGRAVGTIRFRATRYLAGSLGGTVPSGDTVDVHLELDAHLSHLLRSRVSASFVGGPAPGTTVRDYGQTVPDGRGGIRVWWDMDLDGLPHAYPWEAAWEFRLLAPAPGTYPLADITPAAYDDPPAWPPAFASAAFRDDSRLAFSDSGTLVITGYEAPTAAYYGTIRGTITTTFELWKDPATSDGQTFTASATFAIPIWPLGGIPN